jgi:ectoine hydroxylase-related dioxygenase (phytanoyl-CoA dioxygenase family)
MVTLNKLNSTGFAIVPEIYSSVEIDNIVKLIKSIHGNKVLFGSRTFLQKTPGLLDLLINKPMEKIISEVAPGFSIIKSIYFDKPPQGNWFVSLHQDKIIFVKSKLDTVGFKNWTKREDEFGVQPPADILGNIVTVRIHLDDADETNGALKVIPYSHSEAGIRHAVFSTFSDSDTSICRVEAGGIMLMKPLLVHASSKSTSEKARRVIHLEFCNQDVPDGLEWSQKINIER